VDAQDGNNVHASFRNAGGQLLGFALTGSFAGDAALKARLAKEIPAWLA